MKNVINSEKNKFRKNRDVKYDNIWCCDFETLTKESKEYQTEQKTKVYLWYMKSLDGIKEKIGVKLDEFMEILFNSKTNDIYYFHNLSFDGNFIWKWLLRNKPEHFLNFGEVRDYKKEFWNIFKQGRKFYKITINRKIGSKFKRTIIKCSYNLLSSSINSLGKSFNLEKYNDVDELINDGTINNTEEFYNLGGYNMEPRIRNIFIKYIKQDVEIMRLSLNSFINSICKFKYNFINRFSKNLIDERNIHNYLTIGSIFYKLFENYLKNHQNDINPKIEYKNYYFYKKFFYGGWTQFNEKYKTPNFNNLNGIVIDINSSYPFQMTKKLPYGELQETINKEWDDYLIFQEIEIDGCEIKEEYKNFVCLKNWVKDDNNVMFRYIKSTKETFKCYYLKEEFDFLKKIYNFNIKSIKNWYVAAKPYLKDFIINAYEMKQNAKKNGYKGEEQCYKIFLNAGYGQQATRPVFNDEWAVDLEHIDELKQLRDKEELININDELYLIDSISNKEIPFLNKKYVKLFHIQAPYIWCKNILIASTITAYARIQLWEAIEKIGIEKHIYSDTDSNFFKDTTIEEVKQKLNIDKWELGAWDVEFSILKGKVFGAKRYYFEDDNGNKKIGFCGVNDYSEIDFEHLNEGDILKNAQRVVEEDENGIVITSRDLQVKRSYQ